MNCGHTPVVWVRPNGEIVTIAAQVAPLGIIPFDDNDLQPVDVTLDYGYLNLATDGISEARTQGCELGMSRFIALVKKLQGKDTSARLARVIHLFTSGILVTHDDATLLVISSGERDG